MRQYTVTLTLFDLSFALGSFALLGAGCTIMWLDGFDVAFAYLLALPAFFAVATIRSALHRTSKDNQSDARGESHSSSSPAVDDRTA